jgi:diguanylate cyclase (GGDEF)-like protein
VALPGVPLLADDGTGSLVNNSGARAPQLAAVLTLVQDLTGLAHSESAADLYGHAFTTLARAIPFDVGVAVMLEQHLDLYISTRADAGKHVSEKLIARVRDVLRSVIPTEFTKLEIVVKDERRNLAGEGGEAVLDHDVHSILKQENRTAGLVLVCRAGAAFTDDEQRVVEIFSAQLSMLLDNLRAREKILSLADMDDLTGVPNRRYFRRQLTAEMERSRVYGVPLSVLLIDVDDFKMINDTLGHLMGDVVLSELCGTIREMLRSPDAISRFGGDEFAVLLPHTDAAGAAAVADRILERVQALEVTDADNRPIQCTVSIGVTQVEAADATFNDVVRRADARLYDAKRQGKNRYNV